MSTPIEPSDPHLRASDSDRRRTAERLSRALAEGELTADEHTDRAVSAAAARTRGELAALTKDLAIDSAPEDVPWAQRARTPAPYDRPRRHRVAELASGWRSWAGTAVLLTVVWGVASLASGHLTSYWPVWPLAFWGAGLIITGIRGPRNDD